MVLSLEARPDQLADCCGAGWDAVRPAVVVDLLEEGLWDRDDDARRGLLGHSPILRPGQLPDKMRDMREMSAAYPGRQIGKHLIHRLKQMFSLLDV